MDQQFYCIVEGSRGPKVPHESLAAAFVEARRLAQSGQRRVFVLERIGTVEPEGDSTWTIRDSRTPHDSDAPDRAAGKKTVGPAGALPGRP